MNSPLHLYEELMLLALHDRKGTVEIQYIEYAVAGAFLAELLLEGKLSIDDSRKKIVSLRSNTNTDDPLLDDCLAQVSGSGKKRSLSYWISKFSRQSDLRHRIARQLCHRQILRGEEDKVLLVFTRRIYPELNPIPEREIINRIKEALEYESSKASEQTIMLISITDQTGFLRNAIGKHNVKALKQRIKSLTSEESVGIVTGQLIAGVSAAIAAGAFGAAASSG
ncbi:MAG: GPP34 family phosphoprotein [Verrucomicrobiota bacterium]